jgi:2-polyprenyl-3-methyl-5-hydroxy-6-metoxy-1,4-benzoquinol methylase
MLSATVLQVMTDPGPADADQTDADRVATNRAKWEDYAELHPTTEFYDVPGFLADPEGSTLLRPERELLGDCSGEELVHLQCHIGLDTLSWARQGAQVVGVDFAENAVTAARDIRDQAGLADRAEFVRCEVTDAADVLDRQFDVVFASYGVLCWIPDLDAWAETAAALCRPGGRVFLADGHPLLEVFDWDVNLRADASYFRDEPIHYDEPGSYADWDAAVEHGEAYEFQHTLGDVVTAFAQAGLRIERLAEYPIATYPGFGAIEETGDGEYRLPGDPLPMTYALLASRPAAES